VISAYGAFRLLLIMLALWSFFEGFALFTGFGALSLGGNDRTAERVIGLQMIGYVPVYALLAWQRDRYRLLVWVPYFAQLAIIVPVGWAVITGPSGSGLLLLIVSIVFFVMLFYFWWHSHPLDFYAEDVEVYADEDEEEDVDGDDDDGGPPLPPARRASPPPAAKPRDDTRRGRFRRRDQ
jgi:hypothetical protein